MPWELVIAGASALVVSWLVLVAGLLLARPERQSLSAAVRLLPDLVRLIRRLAADRDLPSGVRIRLVLVLAYLALPLDLIPDFIPVLGYADDVIVVALGLRAVVRRAGPDAVRRHWPGTAAGLAVLLRLAGEPP